MINKTVRLFFLALITCIGCLYVNYGLFIETE